MSSHLSRFLFWLAALAAGLSLLDLGPQGLWLAAAAGVALVLRTVLSRKAPALPGVALPESAAPVPADTSLLDVGAELGRRIAASATLPAAMQAVARGLQTELGAQGLTLLRVEQVDADAARVLPLPLTPLRPGLKAGTEASIDLHRFPLGVAIARQAAVGRPDGGFALAVNRPHGDGVALAFETTLLPLPSGPLMQLLELLRGQLQMVADREQAPAPSEPSGTAAQPTPGAGPQFDALHAALPVSMFLFDPHDLRLTDINPHALREFQLRREDVVGRTVQEAFGHALSQIAEPAMRQALASTEMVECDYEWTTRLGSRVLSVRNVALRDAQGVPQRVISVARDVTTERKAQHDLLESQARVNEFAETVEDSLFVTNPERSQFEFLAGSLYDTLGATREQMAERPNCYFDHVLEEDRPLLAARMQRELALQPADVVFRIHHPAKGLRWLRSRTRTLAMPDGLLRVYGLVSDVTDDQIREEQLRAARDAAETASRAKSQFMANMSHEIRTPMNGILGMTELLLGTSLNERQRRFAKAVYRSGESLLEIINDILDFSKIEAGKLELAPADFVLRSVVEDTLELLAPRAHEKGLELNFREQPGLPHRVHGDALRLRQVLTNLVANAIKFTDVGEVVIDLRSLGEVPNDNEAPRLMLEFTVRDTGIGIEEDVLPRLFSAFTQASGAMSRRYGGTGLGLAISRQLIEVMGGTVQVSSAPGVGSQFVFALPMAPAQSAQAEAEPDDARIEALRVLVVEDHPTNRTVIENMLEAWGMTVTLAEDGQAGLDILLGQTDADPPFDLALVDMNMPRLDGISMARALQASGRHAGMKMILLSSVSSPDDVRTAQQAGFDRFLAKPVRKAELRQAIVGVSGTLRERPQEVPRLQGQVLVVEDNVVNQEVISQMLRQMGLQVRIASGALQGLRALCEAHFDLVLMDIMMPGMDGIEALTWFRRGPSERFAFVTPASTPVVAVTANALGGDEERFLGLGFDDYLSKPFRQSQLFAMLNQQLPTPGAARPTDAGSSKEPAATEAVAAGALPPLASDFLDESALQRLRDLDPKGENHLMERVIKAFETSVGRLVPQLREAQQAGNLAGVRHVAHTFKSSSASIGAVRLSQLCAELETQIRTDRLDNLDERVDGVCQEIEVVLQVLHKVLGPQP